MKLQMNNKRKKIEKKVLNACLSALNKAAGCRRFRPGKENSSLKKQTRAMKRLEKDYVRAPKLYDGCSFGLQDCWC